MIRPVALSLALGSLLFGSSQLASSSTHTYNLGESGWHLLGAVGAIEDMTFFDKSCVTTIWSYEDGSWQSYSDAAKEITSIPKGQGFWLKNSSACTLSLGESGDSTLREFSYDLSSERGFEAAFAEYSDAVCDAGSCEMRAEYKPLPVGFGESTEGLMINSENHSDDIFMFIYKEITNLEPDTLYHGSVSASFATEWCDGTVGIGGSPANSNYIHAGFSQEKPQVVKNGDYYETNFAKGNQAGGGGVLELLGDIGIDCESVDKTHYADGFYPKMLTGSEGVDFMSDANGSAWIVVGNDSGFEGETTLYFTKISAEISKKPSVYDGNMTLAFNETKSYDDGKLRVTLEDIEDSRCPEGAQCVSAGSASVTLGVTGLKEVYQTLTLSLGDSADTAQDYSIKFVELTPYPTSDMPLNKDAYSATLEIYASPEK